MTDADYEEVSESRKTAHQRWFGPEPMRWEYQARQRVCRVASNTVNLTADGLTVNIYQLLVCGNTVSSSTAGRLRTRRHCPNCTAMGDKQARKLYEAEHEAWKRRLLRLGGEPCR